jgi:hypothetical protein
MFSAFSFIILYFETSTYHVPFLSRLFDFLGYFLNVIVS